MGLDGLWVGVYVICGAPYKANETSKSIKVHAYDFQGLLFQIEDDALVVDLKSKTKTTPDLSQTHQILQIHKIRQIHHRLKMYCFVHSATLFFGVSQRSISCIEMMF